MKHTLSVHKHCAAATEVGQWWRVLHSGRDHPCPLSQPRTDRDQETGRNQSQGKGTHQVQVLNGRFCQHLLSNTLSNLNTFINTEY